MTNNNKTHFAPHLYIPGGVTDISFYEKAFGAIELLRLNNDNGTVHVAELSINGALFHIHEDKITAGHLSPVQINGTTALVGLFVQDVDAIMASAVNAGGIVVSPAQTYDYGYRQGEVKDPFGHVWLIEQKTTEDSTVTKGYSDVNGLRMYYEIYGKGKPLVLIHGGGSTIQTSFSKIIPLLSKSRQIIAVEMQAHGRTSDRDTLLTFEQDADDVATLLNNLHISKADILGFSNGGHTAIEIALRHPDIINKLILCSAFYKRSGVAPQFWEGFDDGKVQFSNMPQPYKDAFLEGNNDPEALPNMFNKDVQRMRVFKGWTDEQLQSIKAPALVINGNTDVGSIEHAVEMYHTIPNCQLAILPGEHGTYMGELSASRNNDKAVEYFVPLIEEFLDN